MVMIAPVSGSNVQSSRPVDPRGPDSRVVVKQSLATTMPSDRQTSLGILQVDDNKSASGDYDRWKKSKIFNPKQTNSAITAENYLKAKAGFEPIYMNSEKEAKEYDVDSNLGKYPIYFFNTDTSGEKTYEEFYTEEEDYNIKKYDSLGFINTLTVQISFEEVEASFDAIFSNSKSEKLDIIKVIKKYVPDFMHIETGKHLDQKM